MMAWRHCSHCTAVVRRAPFPAAVDRVTVAHRFNTEESRMKPIPFELHRLARERALALRQRALADALAALRRLVPALAQSRAAVHHPDGAQTCHS
jgi:hypothetical protein